MAEYSVRTRYETDDTSSVAVAFDLTPGESGLPGQTKESLVLVVAQAIADALETVVVNTSGATLIDSAAKRYYDAEETLALS